MMMTRPMIPTTVPVLPPSSSSLGLIVMLKVYRWRGGRGRRGRRGGEGGGEREREGRSEAIERKHDSNGTAYLPYFNRVGVVTTPVDSLCMMCILT